jgi:6-phosphogluconate dehydrogenase
MTQTDSSSTEGTAQIGVTGLAVMGSNIARNFAHHGYTVALHNRSIAKTDALLAEHGSEGNFVRSETIPEFLAAVAVFVVPTVALAVPWLTELRRLLNV